MSCPFYLDCVSLPGCRGDSTDRAHLDQYLQKLLPNFLEKMKARLVRIGEQPSEIYNEVVLKLLEKDITIHGARCPYILRITQNHIVDVLRKKAQFTLFLKLLDHDQSSPGQTSKQLAEAMSEIIDRLPELPRNIAHSIMNGMKAAEIKTKLCIDEYQFNVSRALLKERLRTGLKARGFRLPENEPPPNDH